MNQSINNSVCITALQFGRDMTMVPKRMEWAGKVYHFIDSGIRVRARRGEQVVSTITCSDGRQSFCLREAGNRWTLLSVC